MCPCEQRSEFSAHKGDSRVRSRIGPLTLLRHFVYSIWVHIGLSRLCALFLVIPFGFSSVNPFLDLGDFCFSNLTTTCSHLTCVVFVQFVSVRSSVGMAVLPTTCHLRVVPTAIRCHLRIPITTFGMSSWTSAIEMFLRPCSRSSLSLKVSSTLRSLAMLHWTFS